MGIRGDFSCSFTVNRVDHIPFFIYPLDLEEKERVCRDLFAHTPFVGRLYQEGVRVEDIQSITATCDAQTASISVRAGSRYRSFPVWIIEDSAIVYFAVKFMAGGCPFALPFPEELQNWPRISVRRVASILRNDQLSLYVPRPIHRAPSQAVAELKGRIRRIERAQLRIMEENGRLIARLNRALDRPYPPVYIAPPLDGGPPPYQPPAEERRIIRGDLMIKTAAAIFGLTCLMLYVSRAMAREN